ncbi:MAG: nucleotidyltransferase domain-containing protein [Candidatus Poribacteria bacterium]
MNKILYNKLTEISQRLKKEYNAERVILYGSYATDTATEDSDVDLFIVAPTNEGLFKRITTVLRLIRDLKKGIPVEPIILTKEELEERVRIGDQFIMDIIENGESL